MMTIADWVFGCMVFTALVIHALTETVFPAVGYDD